MTDEEPPDILSGLPRSRPHRRSGKRAPQATNARSAGAGKRPATKAKRGASHGAARGETLRQPKQPAGTPPKPTSRRPAPPSGPEIVSTVVHAAAELVEIGLSASARAVRNALSRLPRP